MASLLDLAQARLGGLLAPQRPSMAGLLGGRQPTGTLAGALQGYTPPQMTAMTNPQVMDYARNVAQTAQQNLQTQMSDLDKALVMDQGGINVGDRQALARLMEQIPGLMGATAYHGTPHNIRGQFDISKVGTGEGAQSYGYGMYFAENPAVAKTYQAALSDTKYKVGERELKGNEAWAAQFLHDFQGDALPKRVDADTAIQKANEILRDIETKKEIIENIKKLDKSGVNVESGNFYKVDIPDASIPNMLDWDKPLYEQSPEVKKALESLIQFENRTGDKPWTFKDAIETLDAAPYLRDDPKLNPTGSEIYKMLGTSMKVGNRAEGQKEASEILNNLGIKGIRYLDEGSRGNYRARTTYKGEPYGDIISFNTKGQLDNYIKQKKEEGFGIETFPQTSNFVVFDPTDVKILEKNSQKVEGLLD